MTVETEIARLEGLAKKAANDPSLLVRQLAASMLMHAAIAHLKDAEGAWRRVNEEMYDGLYAVPDEK